MLNKLIFLILSFFLFSGFSTAFAQKATEVYIPIGKSPGVSEKTSVIGTIETIDEENMTITIKSGSESYTGKVTDKTIVYLDKTKSKKSNTTGTLADCKPGSYCEMKYTYENHEQTDKVDWIKLEYDE